MPKFWRQSLDDSRIVIYDRNSLIVQAIGLTCKMSDSAENACHGQTNISFYIMKKKKGFIAIPKAQRLFV
jgi:hypothetical protein